MVNVRDLIFAKFTNLGIEVPKEKREKTIGILNIILQEREWQQKGSCKSYSQSRILMALQKMDDVNRRDFLLKAVDAVEKFEKIFMECWGKNELETV